MNPENPVSNVLSRTYKQSPGAVVYTLALWTSPHSLSTGLPEGSPADANVFEVDGWKRKERTEAVLVGGGLVLVPKVLTLFTRMGGGDPKLSSCPPLSGGCWRFKF